MSIPNFSVTPSDPLQREAQQLRIRLAERRRIMTVGVSTLYAIAGFTAVCSLVAHSLLWVMGWGLVSVTLADSLAEQLRERQSELATPALLASFVFDAAAVAAFVAAGWLFSRGHQWVMIAALVLVGLDTLLCLALLAIVPILLHAGLLWLMWHGLRAGGEVAEIETELARVNSLITTGSLPK